MKATRESLRLREIAQNCLRPDQPEWSELHRISGYLEALEDHIARAREALGPPNASAATPARRR